MAERRFRRGQPGGRGGTVEALAVQMAKPPPERAMEIDPREALGAGDAGENVPEPILQRFGKRLHEKSGRSEAP